MYNETINPKSQTIKLKIPKSLINQELEVIIIPKGKKKKLDKYFGVMKIDDIDNEIKKVRSEWERNI